MNERFVWTAAHQETRDPHISTIASLYTPTRGVYSADKEGILYSVSLF